MRSDNLIEARKQCLKKTNSLSFLGKSGLSNFESLSINLLISLVYLMRCVPYTSYQPDKKIVLFLLFIFGFTQIVQFGK